MLSSKLTFKEILMQYLKDKKNEEAPANSVAGGGVSMPPDAVQDKKKKKEIMTRLGTTVKENKETNSVL